MRHLLCIIGVCIFTTLIQKTDSVRREFNSKIHSANLERRNRNYFFNDFAESDGFPRKARQLKHSLGTGYLKHARPHQKLAERNLGSKFAEAGPVLTVEEPVFGYTQPAVFTTPNRGITAVVWDQVAPAQLTYQPKLEETVVSAAGQPVLADQQPILAQVEFLTPERPVLGAEQPNLTTYQTILAAQQILEDQEPIMTCHELNLIAKQANLGDKKAAIDALLEQKKMEILEKKAQLEVAMAQRKAIIQSEGGLLCKIPTLKV